MKKLLMMVLISLLSPQPVAAATAAQQALASRHFLIGTWNCTFTVVTTQGAKEVAGGPYSTTWSTALDGAWLKQSYDQPAGPMEQPFKAEYFVGYDTNRQAWIRFGVMTTGQYFAMRMTDNGRQGWNWKYVSFFPRRSSAAAPAANAVDATFTRKSDREYTIDGPTYPGESGKFEIEHHICKKV